MKWTLRKTCNGLYLMKWTFMKWFISHEVDANGSYIMKWTFRKTCKWFISHEVDLKKNLQMVHIS